MARPGGLALAEPTHRPGRAERAGWLEMSAARPERAGRPGSPEPLHRRVGAPRAWPLTAMQEHPSSPAPAARLRPPEAPGRSRPGQHRERPGPRAPLAGPPPAGGSDRDWSAAASGRNRQAPRMASPPPAADRRPAAPAASAARAAGMVAARDPGPAAGQRARPPTAACARNCPPSPSRRHRLSSRNRRRTSPGS